LHSETIWFAVTNLNQRQVPPSCAITDPRPPWSTIAIQPILSLAAAGRKKWIQFSAAVVPGGALEVSSASIPTSRVISFHRAGWPPAFVCRDRAATPSVAEETRISASLLRPSVAFKTYISPERRVYTACLRVVRIPASRRPRNQYPASKLGAGKALTGPCCHNRILE